MTKAENCDMFMCMEIVQGSLSHSLSNLAIAAPLPSDSGFGAFLFHKGEYMNELVKNGDKRMTVKEVAAALNCDDETVRRHVKALWPDIFQNGKTTYLDESMVTAVKVGIERSGRNDLRNVAELPNTELEMLMLDEKVSRWKSQRIAELLKQVDLQKVKIGELEPKAEFYDAVTGSKDTIDIGEASKVLGIPGYGRNNLFAFLREKGVLQDNNQPYQTYIDRGYFRTIETKYIEKDGTEHINIKTVVYQKGLDFIRKIIAQEKAGK